jgi:predicted membrane chloride channel (bestrophin family)
MLPWLAIVLVLVVAIILAAVVSCRKTDDPDVKDVADSNTGSANERAPLLSDLEKLDLLREDPDRVKDLLPRMPAQYKHREDHGLLQRNVEQEKIELGFTYMFVYSKRGFEGAEGQMKLLHYDVDRTTGWSALWHVSGSLLGDTHLWRTVAVYWVLCALWAVAVHYSYLEQFIVVRDAAAQVGAATSYLTALLSFMLGLFVSAIIGRWWDCRISCVEALWGSLCNIQLCLTCRLPRAEDASFKETLLRLTLAVHRLVYLEARAEESDDDLQKLVDVGLLLQDEKEVLEGQHSKPQLVLVWIGRLYHGLAVQRSWDESICVYLDEQMGLARNAIGRVFAYCQTQLPYQYVHLLSFCVILCNLLLCFKCGVVIGYSSAPTKDGHRDIVGITLQVFQIVAEPFAYHAFLRLCGELSNPFGHDFNDFPAYAYHCHIRNEGFALHKASEEMPKSTYAAAGQVPHKDGPVDP